MRVSHTTRSISGLGGGMAFSVVGLANAETGHSIDTSICSIEDDGAVISYRGSAAIHLVERTAGKVLRQARLLEHSISETRPDLIHGHGLWDFPSVSAPGVAKKRNIPLVLSPHGMLDSWALSRSKWKKRFARLLFENRNLSQASCFRALCEAEADSIRSLGLRQPICLVPNGVVLPDLAPASQRESETFTLLYLGRLHPKKGLAEALDGWRRVADVKSGADWELVIAGWDQAGYRKELESAFVSDPISNRARIRFLGPVFGQEKDQLLRSSDAFILPSHSEGLPMSILEAWAYHLPVIMTEKCNLPEGFRAGAAIKMEPTFEGAAEAIRYLFSLTPQEREKMGRQGRSLVEQRFTWESVAARTSEVYRWLGGEVGIPSCVSC